MSLVWSRLKSMKCPKCNAAMHEVLRGVECSECDMFIGTEKFNKIVNSMYRPYTPKSEEENLSELNNLGHERISEGFGPDEERDV